ncbi:YceI family protein [Novosphingobium sp.]|uniref:YceI family protein n=1 Tax=Novosphingobium sp. TaxID=1874826 RepID=UPI0025FF43F3|nr:YceI family protein [Novosphingobium sp.]
MPKFTPAIRVMIPAMLAPLALLALAAPGAAQMPMEQPGKPLPARVTAGTYTVDPNHTLIGWKVNHLGFNDYFGIFGMTTGTLVLDPAHPAAAKLDVTIPVSKVTTANAGLTAHLLRPGKDGGKPDFFGPDQADAHFVSTAVKVLPGGRSATITGNLTLNGVTAPVTIAANFSGAGMGMTKALTVGFHGSTTIRRSVFGLAGYVPLISDAVRLDITAAFEKK